MDKWKSVIFNMEQTSYSGCFLQSNQNKKKLQKKSDYQDRNRNIEHNNNIFKLNMSA